MPAQWEFQVGPKKICKTRLGTGHATKTDEFSEKVQTAFDPPHHFQKIILQFFSEIHERSIVDDT